MAQSGSKGTYHAKKDVQKIDEIDLNEKYLAKDLINVIRARTFPPHEGAYFWDGSEKIYLRMKLLKEEELGD